MSTEIDELLRRIEDLEQTRYDDRNDVPNLRRRVEAMELALTYGLRTRDARDEVICALKWAQEYVDAAHGDVMTREAVMEGVGPLLRCDVDGARLFDGKLSGTPVDSILVRAAGRWGASKTAALVRAMQHYEMTWADFGTEDLRKDKP